MKSLNDDDDDDKNCRRWNDENRIGIGHVVRVLVESPNPVGDSGERLEG